MSHAGWSVAVGFALCHERKESAARSVLPRREHRGSTRSGGAGIRAPSPRTLPSSPGPGLLATRRSRPSCTV